MNEITEEQKKVIEKLKSRVIADVTPKMLEDVSLFYRFSKARNFKLEEAETMLRKHIAWRKENQIDTILTDYEPPEVLVKYVPATILGFDKDGSVALLIDSGRTDIFGILNIFKKNEVVKYFVYLIERHRKLMKEPVTKKSWKPLYTVIYNFEELSYAKVTSKKCLEFFFFYLKTFFDNYPEELRRVRLINAPSAFLWVFTAAKPILPDTIYEKIRIYTSDGWKEDLLEFIDADVLPAFLGGNKTDPDGNPLCETYVQFGKLVPKRFHPIYRGKKMPLETSFEKLTILPLSKEEITFEVKEENTFIEWEFEIKTKDINFSLLFREGSSKGLEAEELIAPKRIGNLNESEKGCYKCEKEGNYTIVFDNSFSWLHSKEIFFRAALRNPVNDED